MECIRAEISGSRVSQSWQVPAATNALASGTEMTTDAQGSRVILTADGSGPDKLSDLVHQVAYLNTREFPSPGKRILQLATTLHCRYTYLLLKILS